MNLAFVIPAYNERNTLVELADQIVTYSVPHTPTIWFIDDGSDDGSAEILDQLAAERPEVRVHHFERNYGKTAAISKGFELAEGDIVFTMDADLQDDPREIPRFLEKLAGGYDLVNGWKAVRHDPWRKTFPSRIFNAVISHLFGVPLHDVNCGYKAMRTEVAKSLRLTADQHRLIPVITARQGYRVGEIEVEHHARRFGHSKYTGLGRFWSGARDAARLWWDARRQPRPPNT